MHKIVKNLISLLYPNVCVACDREDAVYDGLFCHFCRENIPIFEDVGENKEILKSRFPLIYDSRFYGLFLFTKSGLVQNIMHKIKYKHRSDIARKLGEQLAEKITDNSYEALIPVPMHTKKLRRRGYNQAEEIAKGIHRITRIPIYNKALKKIIDSKSQTQKDRISRRLNVMKAYRANIPLPVEIKRVLIIDDVITTGATLEVCSEKLSSARDIEIDYAFVALSV